jgi:hypothetical protein
LPVNQCYQYRYKFNAKQGIPKQVFPVESYRKITEPHVALRFKRKEPKGAKAQRSLALTRKR